MPKSYQQMLAELPPVRRREIERRTAKRIAEEYSLRELRQKRSMTQQKVGALMGLAQESVSRLEKRKDILLSTLKSYVEAMGGKLALCVTFGNRPPVILKDLTAPPPKGHTKKKPRK